MVGYLRVSRRMGREGPGYISFDVQREAVQRWADYRGVEIVAWLRDEDESGGTQNRPGLIEAMRYVASGEADGIACWRLNRFARNVADALRDVKRVQAQGGVLAFVEEDIDPTGPFGEFILTVLLAVSTLELNNMKAGWQTAKTRALERGAKIGPTPFGYQRLADGTLTLHPDEAPVVAEAFRLAATRDLQAVCEFLGGADSAHSAGARAGRQRTWTTTTVRRLLANRSYLGEARYEGIEPNRNAHEAIVDAASFEAARPDAPSGRRAARYSPLSGLGRCGTCGERMVGGSGGRGPDGRSLRTYRCRASLSTWKGARCPAPATTLADGLERLVRDELKRLLTQEWSTADDGDDTLLTAEHALHEEEAELESLLADAQLRRTLGPERFERHVAAHVKALEDAQATYREAATTAARNVVVSEPELVASASAEELSELARAVLASVVVQRGRGPITDRVQIVPKGLPTEPRMPASQDP